MTSTDPPDWALPAWDADGPDGWPPVPRRPPAARPRILAVSEVTRTVRDAIRGDDRLTDLWVEGEVGRVTISSAGHGYFNLKDDRSQLACIWFREDRLASPFDARVGLRIVAHGRLDVFEQGGVYQLYVDAIQPAGFGDLAVRFEILKARLAAEGLFDQARKRPLPDRAGSIAVVTSGTGAVWHDIVRVVERRWPLARLVLSPCLVQGDGAAASIVRALERIDRWVDGRSTGGDRRASAGGRADGPVVTIVARGGGSLEDLWAFNDEGVVRAIAAHSRPVVTGIGHETDVTLADFAADVRAPTPSAAAELVVPDRAAEATRLRVLGRRAHSATVDAVAVRRTTIERERRVLAGLRPAATLAASRERAGLLRDRATAFVLGVVERLEGRVGRAAGLVPIVGTAALGRADARLRASSAALATLGPQATLDRGYAIVRRATDGVIVRDPVEAPGGTALDIRAARGAIGATSTGPSDRRSAGR